MCMIQCGSSLWDFVRQNTRMTFWNQYAVWYLLWPSDTHANAWRLPPDIETKESAAVKMLTSTFVGVFVFPLKSLPCRFMSTGTGFRLNFCVWMGACVCAKNCWQDVCSWANRYSSWSDTLRSFNFQGCWRRKKNHITKKVQQKVLHYGLSVCS